MMNNLASLVMDNLRDITAREYPCYARILDHSFSTAPPPFSMNWFGRRYFELARDPEWFANSLVANSALEGYGATQIWNFSTRMHQDEYIEAVQQHALDESRHSTMFVSMLRLTFPGLTMDARTEERIRQQQPRYSPDQLPEARRLAPENRMSADDSINELVGVHLTEIRALVLQYLLRSVIEVYAPATAQQRIGMFCASLIRDEARHIDYTARIFEALANEGRADLMVDLFEKRVRGFNDLTMIELEREKQMAI
ncbi:hypothetical protein [Noviherbaspirillum aerium]|uniref:hypothetical protein n=1 Tax=Noviherbaspirillum aerium TaxID=2588497 RepID=UPI00124E101A|nr:hypothetical protein [Noviherbaspirillum aerium]